MSRSVEIVAGNGKLSDGVYRGLAPDAQLVLVTVSDQGKITEEMRLSTGCP